MDGQELEVCGYGCEDHFLEQDTFLHCNESLAALLRTDLTDGILCDVGMPVLHHGVRYNCRVFCLDRRILLVRPKLFMADDGNYREGRYFTPWKRLNALEDHVLPRVLREATGQATVPFGIGAVATPDTVIAAETCEELWTPRSPHVELFLGGTCAVACLMIIRKWMCRSRMVGWPDPWMHARKYIRQAWRSSGTGRRRTTSCVSSTRAST